MLPDWKKESPQGVGAAYKKAAPGVATKLSGFMQECKEADEAAKRLREDETNKERVANMYFAQALDGGMRAGTGIDLSLFVVNKPVRKLLPCERRFFVDATELTGGQNALRTEDPPGRKRACIVDDRTGAKRIELQTTRCPKTLRLVRPTLFVSTDEGSVGGPFLFYLFAECGIRGAKINDPAHRQWSTLKTR